MVKMPMRSQYRAYIVLYIEILPKLYELIVFGDIYKVAIFNIVSSVNVIAIVV